MDIKPWLKNNTVLITKAGSRAYGLETEDSDYDYRGAVIPPKSYLLGLDRFEQADGEGTIDLVEDLMGPHPTDDVDITLWSLDKMVRLAADGNPNVRREV